MLIEVLANLTHHACGIFLCHSLCMAQMQHIRTCHPDCSHMLEDYLVSTAHDRAIWQMAFETRLARPRSTAYANIVHLRMPYHAIKQKAKDSTCKVQSYKHVCAPLLVYGRFDVLGSTWKAVACLQWLAAVAAVVISKPTCLTLTRTSCELSLGVPSVPRRGRQLEESKSPSWSC